MSRGLGNNCEARITGHTPERPRRAQFAFIWAALWLALAWPVPAGAAGGEDAIYKVLYFHPGADIRIHGGTQDIEGGLAIESVDEISDDEIIASETLREAIGEYFDARAVDSNTMGRVELFDIEDIEILSRSGNHITLKLIYHYGVTTGVRDEAEVLVEIIPNFTNETYYDERYGQPLVVEDSYFPDIAGEIAELGLARGYDEKACEHNYFSPNPCVESIPLFEAFAASQGLPLDLDTAWMFQAYVEGEYARGDRLYASAKGYELPQYEGIGNEVAALGLTPTLEAARGEKGCHYNYYSPNPCPGFIEHWREFAERHGLGLDRLSADIFEAYAEGAYRQGDRLYRVARGIPEPGYVGPGTEVMALGFKSFTGLSRRCQHNPASPNPCVISLEEFEAFAKKHDLPLDLNTADIFESYVRHDVKRGDRLFARAKGIPVEALSDPELLEEIAPLIIDVVPDTPAQTE